MSGLFIEIVDTSPRGWWFNKSAGKYCQVSVVDFCILVDRGLSKVDFIQLWVRTNAIDIFKAYDLASAIKKCRETGIQINGFIEDLTPASLLSVAFCQVRVCPPLEGPVVFEFNFKKLTITGANKYIDSVASNNKDGVFFTTETYDEEQRLREQAVQTQLMQEVVKLMKEGCGISSMKSAYSSSAEAVEEGLLTHTLYYHEFDNKFIPLSTSGFKYSVPRIAVNKRNYWFSIKSKLINYIGVYTLDSNLLTEGFESALFYNFLIRLTSSNFKAIIIVLKYKGGSLKRADEIFSLLNKIQFKIPIITYIHIATSSGLLIASSSSRITVGPYSILGSVGAVSYKVNWNSVFEGFGIKLHNGSSHGDSAYLELLRSNNELGYALLAKRLTDSNFFASEDLNKLKDGFLLNSQSISTNSNVHFNTGLVDVLEMTKKAYCNKGPIRVVSIDADSMTLRFMRKITRFLNRLL